MAEQQGDAGMAKVPPKTAAAGTPQPADQSADLRAEVNELKEMVRAITDQLGQIGQHLPTMSATTGVVDAPLSDGSHTGPAHVRTAHHDRACPPADNIITLRQKADDLARNFPDTGVGLKDYACNLSNALELLDGGQIHPGQDRRTLDEIDDDWFTVEDRAPAAVTTLSDPDRGSLARQVLRALAEPVPPRRSHRPF